MSDIRTVAIENIETEIRKEKAESLGRTGERLEQILVEIRTLRSHLFALAERWLARMEGEHAIPAEIQNGVTKDAELCGRAREIHYQLIVQREAVGLRRHAEVDRHYPMPAPLTLAWLVGRGRPE